MSHSLGAGPRWLFGTDGFRHSRRPPEASEVAVSTGYGSLPRLVSAALLVSPGEAPARVAAAQALCPRRNLTGEALPPLYPATAATVEAGQISWVRRGR